MAKTSNVPRGTIAKGRLRPIMGTSQKSHYNHNLDLTPIINSRFFGVVFGTFDNPEATLDSITIFSDPRKARKRVRWFRKLGFLAEMVIFELPAYYRNK